MSHCLFSCCSVEPGPETGGRGVEDSQNGGFEAVFPFSLLSPSNVAVQRCPAVTPKVGGDSSAVFSHLIRWRAEVLLAQSFSPGSQHTNTAKPE